MRWKSLGEADGRRYSFERSESELYDGAGGRRVVVVASQPGVGGRSGRSGGLTSSSDLGIEGRRLGGDDPSDAAAPISIEGIEGVRPGTGVGAEMLSLNLLGVSGIAILLALRAGRSDFLSAAAREGGDDLRGGGLDMRRSGVGSAVDGRAFW